MVIQEEDFILEWDEGCNRFDLSIAHVVNAKDPTKARTEFKNWGYSMTLEYCLKKIINHRISKKVDTINLERYLKEYKDEVKKIEHLLKLQ